MAQVSAGKDWSETSGRYAPCRQLPFLADGRGSLEAESLAPVNEGLPAGSKGAWAMRQRGVLCYC
jgi:hypothetical protein